MGLQVRSELISEPQFPLQFSDKMAIELLLHTFGVVSIIG